ncbi:glycosyltransferase [Halobacteriales archaeon Cl-PHB]
MVGCKDSRLGYTYIRYDLYPDQPVELGYISEVGLINRVWNWFNVKASHGAKQIVALGPVMGNRITENTNEDFDPVKITIVYNWEDEDFIEPIPKEDNWFCQEHDLVDPLPVLYSGNIGEFHDLETVIKAAVELEDENVRFLIIGEGDIKETIVEFAEDRGIHGDTVQLLPYQPWDDIPYSLTSGDVSVVTAKGGFECLCDTSARGVTGV